MAKITLDAETFKALASATRLSVMRSLDLRRKTLSELARDLELNKATLHEHLGLLSAAGLVRKRDDEGRKWIYYELTWTGQKILHPQETTTFNLLLGAGVLAAGGGIAMLGRALGLWLQMHPATAPASEPVVQPHSFIGAGSSNLAGGDNLGPTIAGAGATQGQFSAAATSPAWRETTTPAASPSPMASPATTTVAPAPTTAAGTSAAAPSASSSPSPSASSAPPTPSPTPPMATTSTAPPSASASSAPAPTPTPTYSSAPGGGGGGGSAPSSTMAYSATPTPTSSPQPPPTYAPPPAPAASSAPAYHMAYDTADRDGQTDSAITAGRLNSAESGVQIRSSSGQAAPNAAHFGFAEEGGWLAVALFVSALVLLALAFVLRGRLRGKPVDAAAASRAAAEEVIPPAADGAVTNAPPGGSGDPLSTDGEVGEDDEGEGLSDRPPPSP